MARGDLTNVDVLKRMGRMMVRPAFCYMQTRIFDKCAKQVSLLKTARILDPLHAAATRSVVAERVDELIEAYRFFKLDRFAGLPDKMKAELPAYSAAVAEIPAGDFDIEAWWRVKQAQFPALSTALRSVLCHIPNSAPPERLFSILNDNVGDDQLRAKADYKMALCILPYNDRDRD